MTTKPIQISDAYYIQYEPKDLRSRGKVWVHAGWNVYAESSGKPLAHHETREKAEADAHRREEKRQERKAARLAKEAEQAAREQEIAKAREAKGPLATPRQVAFIMQLIAEGKHHEGGFYAGPTARDGVELMGKDEASMYIKSLLGDY